MHVATHFLRARWGGAKAGRTFSERAMIGENHSTFRERQRGKGWAECLWQRSFRKRERGGEVGEGNSFFASEQEAFGGGTIGKILGSRATKVVEGGSFASEVVRGG